MPSVPFLGSLLIRRCANLTRLLCWLALRLLFTEREETCVPARGSYISVTTYTYIGPAFVEHREALKELTTDIAQHQQATVSLMKECRMRNDGL